MHNLFSNGKSAIQFLQTAHNFGGHIAVCKCTVHLMQCKVNAGEHPENQTAVQYVTHYSKRYLKGVLHP